MQSSSLTGAVLTVPRGAPAREDVGETNSVHDRRERDGGRRRRGRWRRAGGAELAHVGELGDVVARGGVVALGKGLHDDRLAAIGVRALRAPDGGRVEVR